MAVNYVRWGVDEVPRLIVNQIPVYYLQVSSVDRRLVGNDLEGKKLLNVGCGKYLLDDMAFARRGARVTSIDYDSEEIAEANKRLKSVMAAGEVEKDALHIHAETGDARNLEFEDSTFDVVTTFSALEHMPDANDRDKAFKELVRVLKPGGRFVATFPNAWNLPASYISRKAHARIGQYEYRYTPPALRDMLTQLGLAIEQFDAESIYVFDAFVLRTRLPFLKHVPKICFAPLAGALYAFNAMKPCKALGMRIGYRCRKKEEYLPTS